ncbi:MAG TPA: hypothetical protein VK697_00625, partial [Methylomirabilota bacterium]|nr:hypothetical protein [Methylomirabilota bacterium]
MRSRSLTRFAALVSVVAIAAGACGGSTPATAPPSTAAASAPASTEAASPSAVASTAKPGAIINVNGKDHQVVRWFVGLGSGTNPAQIAFQQTVVN